MQTSDVFIEFQKIPRYSRDAIVTEKIDGTNGCICIGEGGEFRVGSRTRWITEKDDNFGFAAWALENKSDLLNLGPGRHFGEWWGRGIQRGYGLTERRFSLFNTSRWNDETKPACCNVVPILAVGKDIGEAIKDGLGRLLADGSVAAPGFMKPEGVIAYHVAGNLFFKKTIEKDDEWKGKR